MLTNIKERQVSEFMTTDVITIPESEPLCNFENYFNNRSIHHIIIENKDGEASGIISKIDVAKIRSWIVDEKIEAKHIMSSDIITLKPTDLVKDALVIFLKNEIRALPVIDDKEKSIGIITPYDILKAL